jgi:hypothetical protein
MLQWRVVLLKKREAKEADEAEGATKEMNGDGKLMSDG